MCGVQYAFAALSMSQSLLWIVEMSEISVELT
jgi:hypothetical protein